MIAVDEIVRLMKNAGIARGKIDSLLPDQPLDEQGFDSYDRMSLLTELEDHFNVELPDEIAYKLKSLNDIVSHFDSRGEDSTSSPN